MLKKKLLGEIDIDSLARAHSARLRSFIRKHLHDQESVDDIFQQTYLAAIENQSRFQGSAKPQTWLFGIAYNLVRENNRRRYSRATSVPIEDYQSSIPDPYPCPETRMQHQRKISSLLAIFERLPHHMKQVIELSSVHDKNYDGCASALNVPVGTIRSRLSRARSLLRGNAE